jgi:hypothetical protein
MWSETLTSPFPSQQRTGWCACGRFPMEGMGKSRPKRTWFQSNGRRNQHRRCTRTGDVSVRAKNKKNSNDEGMKVHERSNKKCANCSLVFLVQFSSCATCTMQKFLRCYVPYKRKGLSRLPRALLPFTSLDDFLRPTRKHNSNLCLVIGSLDDVTTLAERKFLQSSWMLDALVFVCFVRDVGNFV